MKRKIIVLITCLLLVLCSVIPCFASSDYQACDYIYIPSITQFHTSNFYWWKYDISYTFSFDTVPTSGIFLGVYDGTNGDYSIRWDNGYIKQFSNSSASTFDLSGKHVLTYTKSTLDIDIDDVFALDRYSATTGNTSWNTVVGGWFTSATNIYIYDIDFTTNGVSAYHYVPMYQTSTGLYGLYDTVNDLFFGNATFIGRITPGISSIANNISTIFGTYLGYIGTVAGLIVNNPIILICVLLPIIYLGIYLFRRLLNV